MLAVNGLEAAYGVALAWDMANRADRALDTLAPLLRSDLGETGPAVLETYAAIADRLDERDAAGRARARLLTDYPRSMEAAAAASDGSRLTAEARKIADAAEQLASRALGECAQRIELAALSRDFPAALQELETLRRGIQELAAMAAV